MDPDVDFSFGFAVYKFFEYLEGTGHAFGPGGRLGPREFALSMITIGVVVLAIAVVDYHRTLQILEREYDRKQRSLAGKTGGHHFRDGAGSPHSRSV